MSTRQAIFSSYSFLPCFHLAHLPLHLRHGECHGEILEENKTELSIAVNIKYNSNTFQILALLFASFYVAVAIPTIQGGGGRSVGVHQGGGRPNFGGNNGGLNQISSNDGRRPNFGANNSGGRTNQRNNGGGIPTHGGSNGSGRPNFRGKKGNGGSRPNFGGSKVKARD